MVNLLIAHMGEAYVTAMTGHDSSLRTAMNHYVDACLTLCIPGATIIAGFPAFLLYFYHQHIVPPKPADFKALFAHEDEARLENLVDALYQLHDASLPQLRRGGALRPLVHACFASQVMWYKERQQHRELKVVRDAMIDAMGDKTLGLNLSRQEAEDKFESWSKTLYTGFLAKNLHLNKRHAIDAASASVRNVPSFMVGVQL